MTSLATLVTFVQHRMTMPEEIIATIQQLNFPYLSATKPGMILPTNEAPFTIEAV
jgi:hypothetical protein